MRTMTSIAVSLSALVLVGSLAGCDANQPSVPTQEQIIKADSKSQDAMREYYGNMLKPQSGPKAKAKAKAKQ